MGDYVLFQMWGPYREQVIESHRFYVQQGKDRLLSQFTNIEAESEVFSEQWLNSRSQHFDPDRHDEGDFYEQAYDEGIAHYQLLESLREQTRLSIIAGMFHNWDKELRDWLVREIKHWHRGENVEKAVWKANFIDIFDLLDLLPWSPKNSPFYHSLDRCRLVVNAYKHGEGDALDALKQNYPEFFRDFGPTNAFSSYSFTDLQATDTHLDEFCEAISAFWKAVPENTTKGEIAGTEPKWLVKAFTKDQNQGKIP